LDLTAVGRDLSIIVLIVTAEGYTWGTYINIAEDSKEAWHALKTRNGSRVEAILELRKCDEEADANNSLLFPQRGKDVLRMISHDLGGTQSKQRSTTLEIEFDK
jgi:hypothetical protein